MNATERQNELLSLSESFVKNEISAAHFHSEFLKIWRTKPTEMNSDFQVYKNGVLSSVFCCCDVYCEPEFRMIGDEYYDDEQLRQAVRIYLESDSPDDGFERLKKANLLDCKH